MEIWLFLPGWRDFIWRKPAFNTTLFVNNPNKHSARKCSSSAVFVKFTYAVQPGRWIDTDMPTIFRNGPYRFYFYSSDGAEPPHVHVQRDNAIAKFWLNPLRLDYGSFFGQVELRKIQVIIEANQGTFLEYWDEFFDQ